MGWRGVAWFAHQSPPQSRGGDADPFLPFPLSSLTLLSTRPLPARLRPIRQRDLVASRKQTSRETARQLSRIQQPRSGSYPEFSSNTGPAAIPNPAATVRQLSRVQQQHRPGSYPVPNPVAALAWRAGREG